MLLRRPAADATFDAFEEARRKRQRTLDAEAKDGGSDASGNVDEEEEEWAPLAEFDFFVTLHIPRPHAGSIKISGGDARVRASYHRQAQYYHPHWGSANVDEEAAELHLRRITLAYLCLKDLTRREIYINHGWDGLQKSEEYTELNIWEEDPYEAYDAFFAGVDPADREYLLLNGNAHMSDEEDDGEGEDSYLAQEGEVALALASAAAAANVARAGGGGAAGSADAGSAGPAAAPCTKYDRFAEDVPPIPAPPQSAWGAAAALAGVSSASRNRNLATDVWKELAGVARIDAPGVQRPAVVETPSTSSSTTRLR